jgi:hypothetical protein
MSTLKSIGRKARRLRRDIAKMDPDKVYRIYEGKQHITLTGRQWKAATKPNVDADTRHQEEVPAVVQTEAEAAHTQDNTPRNT